MSKHVLTTLCKRTNFQPCLTRLFNTTVQYNNTQQIRYATTISEIAQQRKQPKRSTGITGLPVVTNAREVCMDLLQQTLDNIKKYGSNGYNDYCQQLCEYRLKVFNEHQNATDIENILRVGQIEEILVQIEKEYELCIAMNTDTEFQALHQPTKEQMEEWKSYTDPMGAPETLTLLTPEMIKLQLENNELWADIDKELDAEGVPPAPKVAVDEKLQKVLGTYAKNIAI